MKTTILPNGNVTSAAHKIRKQLSEQYDVPCRYIDFGDCMKVAMGTRKIEKVRNAFGKVLGTSGDKLVNILLCDPETPVSWGFADMVDRAVEELGINIHRAKQILNELCRDGYLVHAYGYWSVKREARPFEQPMISF